MFELKLVTHFSAAHRLRDYEGKCSKQHGHNWTVTVTISGNRLDKAGMLVDFRDIRHAAEKVVRELDHSDLNEYAAFAHANPTSENVAMHIFRRLAAEFDCADYAVRKVAVSETAGTEACYMETGDD